MLSFDRPRRSGKTIGLVKLMIGRGKNCTYIAPNREMARYAMYMMSTVLTDKKIPHLVSEPQLRIIATDFYVVFIDILSFTDYQKAIAGLPEPYYIDEYPTVLTKLLRGNIGAIAGTTVRVLPDPPEKRDWQEINELYSGRLTKEEYLNEWLCEIKEEEL
jgi:hypothetical protein